ncbi:hypothetical protein ACHAP8_008258 [Fusarium lateritium]
MSDVYSVIPLSVQDPMVSGNASHLVATLQDVGYPLVPASAHMDLPHVGKVTSSKSDLPLQPHKRLLTRGECPYISPSTITSPGLPFIRLAR